MRAIEYAALMLAAGRWARFLQESSIDRSGEACSLKAQHTHWKTHLWVAECKWRLTMLTKNATDKVFVTDSLLHVNLRACLLRLVHVKSRANGRWTSWVIDDLEYLASEGFKCAQQTCMSSTSEQAHWRHQW